MGLYLFISAFIIAVGNLVALYFEYRAFESIFDTYPEVAKHQTYTHWVHVGVYGFLLPLHGYFLYMFLKQSKKALLYEDSEGFNQSFHWLARELIIATKMFRV